MRNRNLPHTKLDKVALASKATTLIPSLALNREQRRAAARNGSLDELAAQLEPPKDNKIWDDVNMQSTSARRMLAVPGSVLPILKAPEIQEIIAEQGKEQLLDKSAAVLAKDVTEFSGFYEGIHKTHADKEGSSTTPDDHFTAIRIFNDYTTYIDQFNANVVPMIETVSEIAGGAHAVLEQRNPEAAKRIQDEVDDYMKRNGLYIKVVQPKLTPEQDPNVITDVETH